MLRLHQRPDSMRWPFLVICFFWVSVFTLSGQNINNFNALTGKKDVPVNAITQDSRGYLWIGTNDGLVKFDGKYPKGYTVEKGLANNQISFLYRTESDVIYVGHSNGKISKVTGEKVDTLEINTQLPEARVTGMFSDKNGNLWVAYYGSGLVRISGNKLSIFNSEKDLPDDNVYSFDADPQGNLWLGTDAGICIVKPAEKPIFENLSSKHGLPDNIVRFIRYNGSGQMLIGMQDSGMCFLDIATRKILKNPFLNTWTQGPVTGISTMPDKKFWLIGTEKNGVLRINDGKLKFFDASNGLPSQDIRCMYFDREQNLWVGTPKGLSQIFDLRYRFLAGSVGLSSSTILSVLESKDHSLFVGTDKSFSEIMLNERGNYVVKTLRDYAKDPSQQVVCLTEGPNGSICYGTYGKGIFIVDPLTGKTNSITSKTGLGSDIISGLYYDGNHTLWVCTIGGGISKVDLTGNYSVKTYTEEDGLSSLYVYKIIQDSKGRIWIATDGGGLQQFDNGKFTIVTKGGEIETKTVYSIAEDQLGRIWFTCAENYVGCWDNGKIKSFGQKNGLRDLQPQALISYGNKIALVHPKGIDIIHTAINDSVSWIDVSENDIEPNLNAASGDDEGNVYFGTTQGILHLRLSDNSQDTMAPVVFINTLSVQFKPYPLGGSTSFAYSENNFTFDLDAVWLRMPGKVKIRYQLIGYDPDWQFLSGSNSVSFKNLPPGDYVFTAQACNEEGRWGKPLTYSFTVARALWMHWWFWVFVAAIVFSGFSAYTKFRTRKLKKEKAVLEEKVQERTQEIQAQAKIIEEKNKDITDSIQYARKIQTSILPPLSLVKEVLPESFVLYMTKDIVSGDFYWFVKKDHFSLIASIDCTGHGVPGAFMSLIGYNLLNQLVNERGMEDPAAILKELNTGLIQALQRDRQQSENKDGMDLAMVKIYHDRKKIEFAGAMRPLWIIRNAHNPHPEDKQFEEIRADKIPIGTNPADRDMPIAYTNHTISDLNDTAFYIFTDGYPDQFGGSSSKKLTTRKFRELLLLNSHQPFEIQGKALREYHLNWRGGQEQVDDILVIGFKI